MKENRRAGGGVAPRVPRPQAMLMDEPFSGLDQRLRDSVRSETPALLRETRASCLLVTHDPVEAMGLADRILVMQQGRLFRSRSPACFDLFKGRERYHITPLRCFVAGTDGFCNIAPP